MHYKNLITKIVFSACFFITAHQVIAATTTAADELAQLLNNTRTMQAKFEQFSINSRGVRVGQKTTGTMMLERPGKFRWEITQPNKQLIIVNKNKTFLYDADLEQVVKRKVDYNNPSNPAMLLSSPVESMTLSFEISKLKKSGQDLWFELKPKTRKNQEAGYQWIKIQFINGRLNAMIIADNLDQKSQINFNNIIINLQISPKKFVFTPPPNTDVFDAD
ncbi:MAG TPA: outer membrane lipoprotein carrier protein LolA [Coxiellaceae bacterium]|nr:outer membrane lipoprotein carrier protein LolA [Coxiellaceae bacterium]